MAALSNALQNLAPCVLPELVPLRIKVQATHYEATHYSYEGAALLEYSSGTIYKCRLREMKAQVPLRVV